MKIYLAGASAEIDLCTSWMQKSRDAGHTIVYDWAANIRAVGDANPRDASHLDRLGWALEDIHHVRGADVFWLLIPSRPTTGAWVELGSAHGVCPTIIASGDWRASIFTSLAKHRFDTHDDAFAWLNLARIT